MNVVYFINDKPVEWGTLSVSEYTDTYVPSCWEPVFKLATEKGIFPEIDSRLKEHSTFKIYPPMPLVFNALESLSPEKIKVVIIGQDPYVKQGEAMGWSFSVPDGTRIPPSLRNIYSELEREGYTGYAGRDTGDLYPWIKKGVFLYNTCLTVDAGVSGSHGDIWEDFTKMVIANIQKEANYVAWILLGAKAQQYERQIILDNCCILKAGHPSPLNRSGGFLGSGVFKKASNFLHSKGIKFTWNLK